LAEIVDDPELRNKIHVFKDRFHAGDLLTDKLVEFRGREDVLVLAIPAGGVQVASRIAERLKLPLDVLVTRKLHIPWNREAGFGAVTWDGFTLFNEPLVASLGLTDDEIREVVAYERAEIERRLRLFRGERPLPELNGKSLIVVDDGLASGFSMLATLRSLRSKEARKIIVAVPTAPISAIELIKPHADVIVCLNIRSGPVFAVADAYRYWYDLTDEEVVDLLKKIKY
jgi:predicted phosphoribosyltransferase